MTGRRAAECLADGIELVQGAGERLQVLAQADPLPRGGLGVAELPQPLVTVERPKPLSPTPPNGMDDVPTKVRTELMVVPPARSRAAIAGPRRAENTDEPSPDAVPLARRAASLMSATVLITTTGPNVSCTAEQSSGT